MGVLPLQFKEGENVQSLGLKGDETFDVLGLNDNLKPRQEITVTATAPDGSKKEFKVLNRIDTAVEVDYYRNGGILHTVLRKLAKSST
jgi:aconitate hydratase